MLSMQIIQTPKIQKQIKQQQPPQYHNHKHKSMSSHSNRKKVNNYMICLDKPLGQGATGKVYLSYCITNPQLAYAAKIINKQAKIAVAGNQYMKQALKRQFVIHSTLKHPNIVNLIQMHQTVNNIYIIQEYCQGTTLKQVLSNRKRLEEGQVRYCLRQICRGYSQLVEKGIIHRDLKPENIMIQGQQLKIGDFGFAKQIATQKQFLTSIVGSPIYMSPQILRGEKYNSKCDVWSLGIVAFQLLYGHFPWHKNMKGPQSVVSLLKILTQPLKFPDQPNISEQMKTFIEQCLQTDQQQRLSWLQIFQHQIFSLQPQFSQFASKYRETAQKAVTLLNNLAQKVTTQQLVGAFLQFRQPSLDYKIFHKIIKQYLIPQAQQIQISIMYEMFDKDCNGVVDIQEWVRAFQVCNNLEVLKLFNELVVEKQMYYQEMSDQFTFMNTARSLKKYQSSTIQQAYDIIMRIIYEGEKGSPLQKIGKKQ